MQTLRWLFHFLLVRPLVLLVFGVNLRHAERLPVSGPAIIIANHNNHMDTFVLMSLFPMRQMLSLRAAAADDYFLSNRLLAWVAINMFGIIPVKRADWRRRDGDPLAGCSRALERGEILIIYPEGTRGEAECMTEFKPGFAHLARRHPNVPVFPVFLHGLGKILPKGAIVPVPFICDVFIGSSMCWNGNRQDFTRELQNRISSLAREGNIPIWM
jgi:1-acyl-sn-glycerol-3-phosphate acyltransferase